MLVILETLRHGYNLKIVNKRNRRRVCNLLEWNYHPGEQSSIYFQNYEKLPFEHIPKYLMKDFKKGWDIKFRISLENYMALFGIVY